MKKTLLTALIAFSFAFATAQVPSTLSYQGILVKTSPPADAGKPVDDGTHFVRFRFYTTTTGGTPVYSSTGTGSGNQVTTFKGMFSFIIGSGSPGNDPIPAAIFSSQLYVEIEADGVTFPTRIPLTTSPYAFVAQTANTMNAANLTGTLDPARIAAGAIDNSKIASGIDAAKITTGTLPAARIGNDAIDNTKMADNAINTAEIVNNAVTSAKIADGTIVTLDLADGAVTSAKVADGTIAAIDLADGAINSAKLADAAATLTKIADNSVNSAKIVDASIGTADLADGSVTSAKIADGAVTAAKLAAGATHTGTGANGQVTFWTGVSSMAGNSSFFWDNTNSRLGIGTSSPLSPLTVNTSSAIPLSLRSSAFETNIELNNTSTGGQNWWIISGGATGSAFSGGKFGIYNASTGTPHFAITNVGNVGIGTTFPVARLDVHGTAVFRGFTGINRTNQITSSEVFGIEGIAASNTYTGMYINGTDNASFPFYGYATGGMARMWHYYDGGTGNWTLINGGDRLSVTNNGRVGININNPTRAVEVNSGGTYQALRLRSTSSGAGIELLSTASEDWLITTWGNNLVLVHSANDFTSQIDQYVFSTTSFRPFADNAKSLGTIGNRWTSVFAVNGTIQTSDARLKSNILDLTYGLNEVLRLHPVTFTWKDSKNSNKKIGLIAQEVQKIIPELVTEGEEAPNWLGMNYGEIVPVLIKAIQEQQLLINTQNATLTDMKAELAELRRMVMTLQPGTTPATTSASIGKE